PTSMSLDEVVEEVEAVERSIISRVSSVHAIRVEDFFPVPPGSLPLTTSGKVRRSSCVEMYRSGQFVRVDVDDEFDGESESSDVDDVLVVDGRDHRPDDIEATISKVTDGLAAAIAVPRDRTDELVAIVELTT